MAIFTITSRDLNDSSFTVPAALASNLSQRDWSYLCERLRGVDAEAMCCSVTCSFILCICITPLAFVLCPCIYQCRVTTEKRRIINELNATIFQGRPVLDMHFNNVTLNTDFLPGNVVLAQSQYAGAQAQTSQPVIISNEYVQYAPAGQQYQQSPYAPPGAKAAAYAQQPVMASAEPSYPPIMASAVPAVSAPATSPSYTSPPAAAPEQQQQRMMAFRVPEGVQAGALIRVMSPSNTAVDVTVPAGVSAGEEILVPF